MVPAQVRVFLSLLMKDFLQGECSREAHDAMPRPYARDAHRPAMLHSLTKRYTLQLPMLRAPCILVMPPKKWQLLSDSTYIIAPIFHPEVPHATHHCHSLPRVLLS